MWNSRAGDPMDNSQGFVFPEPEGTTLSYLPHLPTAQAFSPPTERVEAAGFHFPGDNDDLRAEVVRRLNTTDGYRKRFARVFSHVKAGGPITFDDRGVRVHPGLCERAHRPLCARHPQCFVDITEAGGRALLRSSGCVSCHAVSGESNEMFSDFRQHVAGIPQINPSFSNMVFDGPGMDEDFGLEQVTGDSGGRYAFRTSPLGNVALQPAFIHNGAFVRLDDAIRYHLAAVDGAAAYNTALLPADLRGAMGPMQPAPDRLDLLLRTDPQLNEDEFDALVAFVRDGLLDPGARPQRLRRLIPHRLPSGGAARTFEHR
jgi:cytochrome c peroxidase